jgi:hypothetical protein
MVTKIQWKFAKTYRANLYNLVFFLGFDWSRKPEPSEKWEKILVSR